jgi:Putative peptidoglycan binding domain
MGFIFPPKASTPPPPQEITIPQRPNGGAREYANLDDKRPGYDPNRDPDLGILRRGIEVNPRMGEQLELLRFSRKDVVLWSVRTNVQKALIKQGLGVTGDFLLPFCSALVSQSSAERASAVQRLELLVEEASGLRSLNLEAQQRLKGAGFNPGSLDGVLGPKTEAALHAYQRAHNLPVTGKLDDVTRRALHLI